MWATRVSIQNPVLATMAMATLVVLGVLSLARLPVEKMPDARNTDIFVSTAYPGASAESVEAEVTKPLEEAINSMGGLRSIRSISGPGRSLVIAEFEQGIDPTPLAQAVRERVAETTRWFGRDIESPSVYRPGSEDDSPVFWLTLSSASRSLREVSDVAQSLVAKRLQGVKGVASIQVGGGVERELAIELKPEKMAAYGIGIDQIVSAIRLENQDSAIGSLVSDRAERVVSVRGRLREARDFERVIVARRGTGESTTAITLGQLATVRDTQREATSIALDDGTPSVSIEVSKVRGTNTVEMAGAVRQRLEDLRRSLPEDIRLNIRYDNSVAIQDSVRNTRNMLLEGAALTVLIVFLFLRSWRSTVITGLALPISVVATFTALYLCGFAINLLTLLAFALCIGVLIDDAIVVRENIVRHLAMGKSHLQAAIDGTQEIGLAVMATTFTLVAVFVPVAFIGGALGNYFLQFGVTAAVAVLVSLFVSFTLDPMLSAHWRDPPSPWLQRGPVGATLDAVERGMQAALRGYDRLLCWALSSRRYRLWLPTVTLAEWLRHGFSPGHLRLERATLRNRGIVLGIAAAALAGAAALVHLGLVRTEFLPDPDEGTAVLRIQTPVGSSLAYTNAKAEQVEALLREFPEVQRVTRNVSSNIARFSVQLVERRQRSRSQDELSAEFRKRVRSVAGLEVSVGWGRLQVSVQGPDITELDRIARDVIPRLKAVKGIGEVESTYKPNSPALDIVVNRELASDLGVSLAQVSATARALIGGQPAGRWEGPDGLSHPILVRLPKDERTGIADLDRLYVASYSFNADATPRMVPLRQIAEFRPTLSERRIERRNLQREVTLRGMIDPGADFGGVSAEARRVLQATPLPAGYSLRLGGESEWVEESTQSSTLAIALAAVFIYVVLASQFGSFLQPLAIMAALPLSLVGALGALALFDSSLNLFSMIGLVTLMGLVTKNAILLVDAVNRRLREGKPLDDSIREAGQVRLRPILMTTAAMIFGMLPLALALGAGSEYHAPIAHAVIGGILSSTILTLVVVPVLVAYIEALRGRKAPP